jgi:hypothetical protein
MLRHGERAKGWALVGGPFMKAFCRTLGLIPHGGTGISGLAFDVRIDCNIMSDHFARVFSALKPVLRSQASRLSVAKDTGTEYTLVTRGPSPFPQHKGQPMWFGAVKIAKAYVSYHLMPLYMNPKLTSTISSKLQKRMQGKSCFNFKVMPEPEIIEELKRLTAAAVEHWADGNLL